MKIVEISYERTVSENYQSRKFGMKAIPEEGEHPDMCAQFLIERVHTHLGLKPNAAATGHLSTQERPAKADQAKAQLEEKRNEKNTDEATKTETNKVNAQEVSSSKEASTEARSEDKSTKTSKVTSKASAKKDNAAESKTSNTEVKTPAQEESTTKEDTTPTGIPDTGASSTQSQSVATTTSVEAPKTEEKKTKAVNPALCYNRELLPHKKEFSRLVSTLLPDWQKKGQDLIDKVQALSRKMEGKQMFVKDGETHQAFLDEIKVGLGL